MTERRHDTAQSHFVFSLHGVLEKKKTAAVPWKMVNCSWRQVVIFRDWNLPHWLWESGDFSRNYKFDLWQSTISTQEKSHWMWKPKLRRLLHISHRLWTYISTMVPQRILQSCDVPPVWQPLAVRTVQQG